MGRAFATRGWWKKFPLCKLDVTHTSCSDHDPIVLDLMHMSFSRKHFHFKFENTLLKEPNFHNEVVAFWKNLLASHSLPKLVSVSSAKWGRIFSINFERRSKNRRTLLTL